jgi:hypothetical protein
VSPASIGVSETITFDKLRKRAVVREAGPGTYYLDEPSWDALRALRRRLGFMLLLAVLLGALLLWRQAA